MNSVGGGREGAMLIARGRITLSSFLWRFKCAFPSVDLFQKRRIVCQISIGILKSLM